MNLSTPDSEYVLLLVEPEAFEWTHIALIERILTQ